MYSSGSRANYRTRILVFHVLNIHIKMSDVSRVECMESQTHGRASINPSSLLFDLISGGMRHCSMFGINPEQQSECCVKKPRGFERSRGGVNGREGKGERPMARG